MSSIFTHKLKMWYLAHQVLKSERVYFLFLVNKYDRVYTYLKYIFKVHPNICAFFNVFKNVCKNWQMKTEVEKIIQLILINSQLAIKQISWFGYFWFICCFVFLLLLFYFWRNFLKHRQKKAITTKYLNQNTLKTFIKPHAIILPNIIKLIFCCHIKYIIKYLFQNVFL